MENEIVLYLKVQNAHIKLLQNPASDFKDCDVHVTDTHSTTGSCTECK
jgi:hypothetical protein